MEAKDTVRQRVVDVHAHFVPEAYREALEAAGVTHPDGSPIPPWSIEAHVEALDQLGVTTAVLSVSSPGPVVDGRAAYWARALNEEGAAIRRAHPDRFGWLACLPVPDVDAALAELDHACDELDADGVGLLTQQDGVYLGDPALEPVMDALDQRGLTVSIHPTSPAGCEHVDMGRPAPLLEYLFDTTRAVVNLVLSGTLGRHPNIRWVIPHNGAALASVADRIALFQQQILHSPVELDIETALRRLYFEVGSSAPFPRTAAAVRTLAADDHLVLGTDLPYAPPPAVQDNITRIRAGELLTGTALDQLCHGTADQLFPHLTRRVTGQ